MSLQAIDSESLNTLVRQAQQEDEQAFEQLLGICYDDMYRFALKVTGRADFAADATQESCLKLVTAIHSFKFEARFSSWLFRLVSNVCVDHIRKQNCEDQALANTFEPVREGTGPDDIAMKAVVLSETLQSINRFGKDMLETVLLVHLGGATHREAAKLLKVKESTISVRLHEIRKRLAERKKSRSAASPAALTGGKS